MAENQVADNQNLHCGQQKIHFVFEERFLGRDLAALRQQFPQAADLFAEDALERLFRGIFQSQVQTAVYLRNLSTAERKAAGVRPVIYGEDDYLSQLFGTGWSLLITGWPRGRDFAVSHLQAVTDDAQLPYEAQAALISCQTGAEAGWNFMGSFLKESGSLATHTAECLQDWEECLDWQEELISRRMAGGRYYRYELVEDAEGRERLVFDLVFSDEDAFHSFLRKPAKRSFSAVPLDWSADHWRYVFAGIQLPNGQVRQISRTSLGEKLDVVLARPAGAQDHLPKAAAAAFLAPYHVRLSCELPQDEDGRTHGEKFCRELPQDGFLTVPPLTLWPMQRQRQAIRDFKQGKCDAANLWMWLFDIRQARTKTPDAPNWIPVEDWQNPAIAANRDQRLAVEKMLNAPDVCLIQGPPGTGKTAVIAEAIYQFAKRGQRVLLASQSNDAVDNAISRLEKTAGIRPIRIDMNEGSFKGSRDNPYAEHSVLHTFYREHLGAPVRNQLAAWQELDEAAAVTRQQLADAGHRQTELQQYEEKLAQMENQLRGIFGDFAKVSARQQKLSNAAEDARQAEAGLRVLQENLLDGRTQTVYLPQSLKQEAASCLQKLTSDAAEDGFRLTPEINALLRAAGLLDGLAGKMPATGNTADAAIVQELTVKRNKLMAQTASMLDDTAFEQALRELRALNLKIEECRIPPDTILTAEEVDLLSPASRERLQQGDRAVDGTARKLAARIRQALAETAERIAIRLSSAPDHRKEQSALDEKRKELQGKRKVLQEAEAKTRTSITLRTQELSRLQQEFQANDIGESLLAAIRQKLARQEKELEDVRERRTLLEKTLTAYLQKLDDPQTATADAAPLSETYLRSCNVIGTSCTANMRRLEKLGPFDVVIIDEVSKATAPELLMPLLHARKAVLVGDHRQLPPLFEEHEQSYAEICAQVAEEGSDAAESSLLTPENFQRFRRLVTASLFKEAFERADDANRHSLTVQYRMHPDIMAVTNRFYDSRLACGWSKEEADARKDHGITLQGLDHTAFLTPEKHAVWLDAERLPDGMPCYELHPEDRAKSSLYNPLELHLILNTVRGIAADCRRRKVRKDIGIIFFYYAQVYKMRQLLKKLSPEEREFIRISTDTVDKFQGREKQIVIVGLTRNKRSTRVSEHVLAFERINVAFSRAQELLIIVGAQDFFGKLPVTLPKMDAPETVTTQVYQHIADRLRENGAIAGPEKMLTPQDVQELHETYAQQRRR